MEREKKSVGKKRVVVMLSIIAAVGIVLFVVTSCGKGEDGVKEIVGITAVDVYTEYDGNAHGITLNNVAEGDRVTYRASGSEQWTEEMPSYTVPGEYETEYKVERAGYTPYTGKAKITITKAILRGITSPTVTVVYDGESHGIEILGAQATDRITYSTDGTSYAEEKSMWTEPGEYDVYYAVEREYGEYRGSGVVRILPDISGRYLNARHGVIELTHTAATVDGRERDMEYDCTGNGRIGNDEFGVITETLIYKDEEYIKINEQDKVHELKINDESIYLREENGKRTVTVKIKDGAEIVYNGETVTTVYGYNYCETGVVTDYVELAFEIPLEDGQTEIELSVRQRQSAKELTTIKVYDGNAHDFEIEGYVFLSEQTRYVEVGKYTATVVELSEEYLPEVRTATLVILPDITGVYADETTAVEITERRVEINGREKELEPTIDGWVVDGAIAETTDGGIRLNGKEYKRVEGRAVVITVGEKTETVTYALTADAYMLIRLADGELEIEYDGREIYSARIGDGTVTVTAGKAAVPSDGDGSFILGASELAHTLIFVTVSAVE